jgi:glycosyltransferase involved in cell wall biosynthesis
MKYAKNYYSDYNPSLIYKQLYLTINTFACDGISNSDKENQALFFARFGQKHKNNEAIFNIVRVLPERFRLSVLGNKDAAAPEFIEKLEKAYRQKNITLDFYKNISDKEKFEILKKTKIVFFSSKFEGYGIPPLEAQYMGASVICSDLPVLREVNPLAYFVDFDDEQQLSEKVQEIINNPQDAMKLRSQVEKIASPNVFFTNLDKIIKSL